MHNDRNPAPIYRWIVYYRDHPRQPEKAMTFFSRSEEGACAQYVRKTRDSADYGRFITRVVRDSR